MHPTPRQFLQHGGKDALIESIFPDLQANYTNHAWLWERAILAAKI